MSKIRVKVQFEVGLPDVEHTQEQLEEFLRFHFRDNGSISLKNPFEKEMNREPEPIFGTFEVDYI